MSDKGTEKTRHGFFAGVTLALRFAAELMRVGVRGLLAAPVVANPKVSVDSSIPLSPQLKGRAADRTEHPVEHEQLGTLLIVLMVAIAITAGVGFLIAYWSQAGTMVLGGTLALVLGGAGSALVLSAHLLMPKKQATEEREKMPSPPDERADTLSAFNDGVEEIHRRTLLKWMGAIATGMMAAIVISVLRSFERQPTPDLMDTVWKRGQILTTEDGKPVTVTSLDVGSGITVFPSDKLGNERAQTMLLRVPPHLLQLPANRQDWAPMGYVAYSRLCTHAGCNVALFEENPLQLLCPCHQSTFDPTRGAKPSGGPAVRSLPQLPLYADEQGYLRAAGGFTNPPGPGFWGMP
jgi:quinol---cytochrome c reductase iron-sulfur subunit